MLKYDLKILRKCANNLMFDMSEEQYQVLLKEFETITKQMELLGDIENIDDVKPMVFPFETTTLGMREDEVKDQLDKKDVLKNAAEVQNDMVKVQKVVG